MTLNFSLAFSQYSTLNCEHKKIKRLTLKKQNIPNTVGKTSPLLMQINASDVI